MTPPLPLVLNVNDDDAARYVVRRVLEKAGYRIREAASGLEALAAVREERPVLIVLDVQLPDVDGLEVCRRLKSDPATSDIPVLQTSATFVSADRKVQGLESGADGYLAQPIEPPELLATVRALLRANVAEQQVREAAVDWQQTFDALVEAVLVVDGSGRVMRVNRAARALCSNNELLGVALSDVMSQIVGGSKIDWLHAARESRKRETTVVPKERRWFEVSVDPVLESDSKEHHRYVVVLSDVTAPRELIEQERRRAAELDEANRRKDEFLAMLAHELRNPLNAIATANALSGRLDPGDSRLGWVRETVARQASQLSRMVDDLLEVSRIARGRVQVHLIPLDLRDVLRNSIDASRAAIDSRRQRLHLVMPDTTLPILGDALRLEQVFVNVINNASKYSETGSDITVTAERHGDRLSVRVRDQGVGIPAEHLEAIFEPFMQVDQSLARTLGGIGIGLTLARGLIEQHGGSISASSEGTGRGTTIEIELPFASAAGELSEGPASTPEPATDVLSVLVIDDNREAADLLRTLLETRSHTVRIANDGPAGLDAALSLCPDVALIDIGLPGIDGYQVAASLRASRACRDTFLVAITGYGRPEDRARAIESGFDHFIVKPLRVDELERVLARIGKRPAGRSASPR